MPNRFTALIDQNFNPSFASAISIHCVEWKTKALEFVSFTSYTKDWYNYFTTLWCFVAEVDDATAVAILEECFSEIDEEKLEEQAARAARGEATDYKL